MLQLPIYQSPVNFDQFSPLGYLSSIISFSPMLSWIAVGLIGLFFLVISLILSYHWKKFEIDKLVIGQAAITYFSVSTVLVVMMVISLAIYLNSF